MKVSAPPVHAASRLRDRTLAGYITRLVLMGMVSLMALGAWLVSLDVRNLQAERRRAAEQVLMRCRDTLDQFLAQRIRALQMLAASPLLDRPDRWRSCTGRPGPTGKRSATR